MPVYSSNVRSVCCPQGVPSPSEATIPKENLRATAELSIPTGGSVSFKCQTATGSSWTSPSFGTNTIAYGTSGEMLLKRKEGQNYTLDINNKITSITAIIKDASGKVTEQDLLAKPEVAKPEAPKLEAPKPEVAMPVGEKAATSSVPDAKPKVIPTVEPKAALEALGDLFMPLLGKLANNESEVPPVVPTTQRPETKAQPTESPAVSMPNTSASDPIEPAIDLGSVKISDEGPIVKLPAPMTDDELLLAPSTNDIADALFGKIEAGATAPIDSGLTARSIGSGTSEVSPFEEVPSAKSVAKASPAAEKSKQEPKVNTLDLTKLEPGSKLHFRVQGDPLGDSAWANVPKNATDPLGSARGNFIPNEDGTFKFVVDQGQNLKFFIPGKEDAVVKNAVAESSAKVDNKPAPQKQVVASPNNQSTKSVPSEQTESKSSGPTLYTGQLNEVSMSDVAKVIQAHHDKKIFIDFYSQACTLCPGHATTVDNYARKNNDQGVIFLKVDIGGYNNTVNLGNGNSVSIDGVPHNTIIDNRKIDNVRGIMTDREIERKLK